MTMHITRAPYLFVLACLYLLSPALPAADVDLLFSQALADLPGRTGQILTVEYAPGEASARHRHNAHTFVYVLEGSVVMQVKGSPAQTLAAGETFYERPDDIHSVSKNASQTRPARILVFFIKDTGAPASVPVK